MKAKKLISILLCILLVSALTVPAFAADFTDTEGHWAEHQIDLVAEAGIVGGYADGSFRPKDNLTRAQMMVIISRLLVDADGNFATVQIINNNGTEDVTVNMIAYNDYSVRLNVPDKKVSADKFLVKTNIEAIPGMENLGGILGNILKGLLGERETEIDTGTVSYTHLTLPTILLV